LPSDTTAVRAQIDQALDGLRHLQRVTDWRAHQLQTEAQLELSTQIGYQAGRGKALAVLGFACYSRSEFRQALAHAEEARGILETGDDPLAFADALGVLALVHWSLGNFDRAVEVGLRSLRIHQDRGNEEGIAWCYNTSGGISLDLGDTAQALESQRKAIEIFRRLNNQFGLARSLTGLGVVYRTLGEYDAALQVHEESLTLFRTSPNPAGEARALNDIGMIHQERKDYPKALEFHLQALAIRERLDTPQSLTTSQLNVGHIYRLTGRHEEAEEILTKALAIAQAIEVKPRIYQAHQELAELFEAMGDVTRALRHFKEFHRVRDIVFSDEASTRLHNLQIAYETETSRREAEIQRLKNVELAQAMADLQSAQAQLIQSEKMAALGDLVAGVAHELNSPLAVIMSASQLNDTLAERLSGDREDPKKQHRVLETLTENSKSIHVAASRISRIVKSLKGFARLDEAEYQLTDLHRGIEETLVLLEPRYRERVEIARQFGDIPDIYCYAAELNQVYLVLLENAFEAIDGSGTVEIRSGLREDHIYLSFRDTGPGIAPEVLPKMFHPSFRKTGARVEARMGLFGAYHIVQKHGGDLRAASEPGKGATFTLVLPARTEDTPESASRPKLS
jgi:two-component system, NtrC family, sensor kinase